MQRDKFEELRRKAEEAIAKNESQQTDGQMQMAELLHELSVHQAELEMQNEELRNTQRHLEQSKNNYFDLYEYAPVGYLNMNRQGVVRRVNNAVIEMLGVPRNAILSRPFTEFIEPRYLDVFYRHLDRVAISTGSEACELALRKSDKSTVYVRMESTYPGMSYKGETVIRNAIMDITQLNRARQQLQHLNAELEQKVAQRTALADQRLDQLKKLNLELIHAEQRQKQQLAESLHDNLQQLLVSSQLNLSFTLNSRDEKEKQDFLKRTEETLKQAIEMTRSLTQELYPPLLYQSGLRAALEWYGGQMKNLHGLVTEVHVGPGVRRYPRDVEIFVFECARELLLYIVKHGKTARACVDLEYADGSISLQVADQGTGLDCEALLQGERKAGIGLSNIKNRIETMGGTFRVISCDGTSCIVSLSLPCEIQAPAGKAVPELLEAEMAMPPAEKKGKAPIRVMLVDDHQILRRGLVRLLERHEDIAVIGEAEDGVKAVERARVFKPDVILMDIGMPVMDGLQATEQIMHEDPNMRIIALTLHEEEWMVNRMLEAGACRYLSKTTQPEVLVEAIRDAASAKVA